MFWELFKMNVDTNTEVTYLVSIKLTVPLQHTIKLYHFITTYKTLHHTVELYNVVQNYNTKQHTTKLHMLCNFTTYFTSRILQHTIKL